MSTLHPDPTPAEIESARRHVDAIADTGVGYSYTSGYRVRCEWCAWETTRPRLRDAVAEYRKHEQSVIANWRQP